MWFSYNFCIWGARIPIMLITFNYTKQYGINETLSFSYVSDGTYGEEYHRHENRERFQPV